MTHSIEWDGIIVAISHTANWLNSEYHHIELRADEPLPVTQTGYRSHFMNEEEFALFGDVTEFVIQWLDEAAKSREWISYKKKSRQLSLF